MSYALLLFLCFALASRLLWFDITCSLPVDSFAIALHEFELVIPINFPVCIVIDVAMAISRLGT